MSILAQHLSHFSSVYVPSDFVPEIELFRKNGINNFFIKFWSVFDELDESEKKALLEFFTGSDRVPIGGLGRLKPRLQSSGPDSDRLPTGENIFKIRNISY